jgi:hypothetical protein
MGHEMCSVSFHLLVRGYGAEDDLGEPSVSEFSKSYAANDFQGRFDDSDGQMITVVDEASDVVFGHFRELLLEQAFEASEGDHALFGAIIVDDSELDLAIPFFQDCRLQTVRVCAPGVCLLKMPAYLLWKRNPPA